MFIVTPTTVRVRKVRHELRVGLQQVLLIIFDYHQQELVIIVLVFIKCFLFSFLFPFCLFYLKIYDYYVSAVKSARKHPVKSTGEYQSLQGHSCKYERPIHFVFLSNILLFTEGKLCFRHIFHLPL